MLSMMHFLDADEKKLVMGMMEPLAFQEDEVIIREGGLNATLFKIEHGVVRVIRRVEGKELILDDLHEGDAFGELTFLEGGPSSAECKALSPRACWPCTERSSTGSAKPIRRSAPACGWPWR